MHKPDDCPDDIFDQAIANCWNADPNDRPVLKELAEFFTRYLAGLPVEVTGGRAEGRVDAGKDSNPVSEYEVCSTLLYSAYCLLRSRFSWGFLAAQSMEGVPRRNLPPAPAPAPINAPQK
jgi:hypothetical protein